MSSQLTRRQIATGLLVIPALTTGAISAQTSAPPPPASLPTSGPPSERPEDPAVKAAPGPVDETVRAHENLKRNSEALAKFEVNMAVEPAFAFKP